MFITYARGKCSTSWIWKAQRSSNHIKGGLLVPWLNQRFSLEYITSLASLFRPVDLENFLISVISILNTFITFMFNCQILWWKFLVYTQKSSLNTLSLCICPWTVLFLPFPKRHHFFYLSLNPFFFGFLTLPYPFLGGGSPPIFLRSWYLAYW